MILFILKRLVTALPTLLAVLTVIFFVVRLAPGDPAHVILGDTASAEAIAALRTRLGLDEPLWKQYFDFVAGVARGDLGTSLTSGRSVWSDVADVLPFTLELTFAAILIGAVTGLPLGILAAQHCNRMLDYVVRTTSLFGLSFPAFFTAIVLMLVFSLGLGWFPVITEQDLSTPLKRLHNLVLPAASLGLIMTAYVARATRSSMLEVLSQDYIRTARAKGLAPRLIIWRHALRNALIPIVTVIGLYLGLLIGNSVLTEIVFNRPGLGNLIVTALEERDYATLQGLMIVYAFFIVLTNVLTDLAYGFADPRVRAS